MVEKFKLVKFLSGEHVDLCIPTREFAMESNWYNWFNSPKTTRFLEQGLFPNTVQHQVAFYDNLVNSNERLSLIISDRNKYLGTISLSFINQVKKTADIALLIGEESDSEYKDWIALEAMSLLSAFGIEQLGIRKISAGQHEKLKKWQIKLELIGYRVEGVKFKSFIKGREVADAISIALLEDDYYEILKNRDKLFDNVDKMINRLDNMPSVPFVDIIKKTLEEEGNNYYNQIFKL